MSARFGNPYSFHTDQFSLRKKQIPQMPVLQKAICGRYLSNRLDWLISSIFFIAGKNRTGVLRDHADLLVWDLCCDNGVCALHRQLPLAPACPRALGISVTLHVYMARRCRWVVLHVYMRSSEVLPSKLAADWQV